MSETTADTTGDRNAYSVFPPLAIGLGSFLILLLLQSAQLLRESHGLAEAKERQATPMEEAQKMRAQLDAVASGLQRLAEAGNANAQRLVDELKQRGVRIASQQQ